jgi:hypothetical protein
MAPPPTAGTTAPPAWTSLVPMLLPGLLFAIAVLWFAPRKGRSPWLALLAFIPCGGFLVVLYLLSLTDKRVLDDIETLKKQIGRQDGDDPKS